MERVGFAIRYADVAGGGGGGEAATGARGLAVIN